MAEMTSSRKRESLANDVLDDSSAIRSNDNELDQIRLGNLENDIDFGRPLTADERRRFGVGLTLEEAIQRMNEAETKLDRKSTGD
jgi:hypothetical protein